MLGIGCLLFHKSDLGPPMALRVATYLSWKEI